MEASLLNAELTIDDAGCIILTGGMVPVWPKGYTVIGDPQNFMVLDAGGEAVARSGVQFSMGGGGVLGTDGRWANLECIADQGPVWMVGKVDRP